MRLESVNKEKEWEQEKKGLSKERDTLISRIEKLRSALHDEGCKSLLSEDKQVLNISKGLSGLCETKYPLLNKISNVLDAILPSSGGKEFEKQMGLITRAAMHREEEVKKSEARVKQYLDDIKKEWDERLEQLAEEKEWSKEKVELLNQIKELMITLNAEVCKSIMGQEGNKKNSELSVDNDKQKSWLKRCSDSFDKTFSKMLGISTLHAAMAKVAEDKARVEVLVEEKTRLLEEEKEKARTHMETVKKEKDETIDRLRKRIAVLEKEKEERTKKVSFPPGSLKP